MSELLAVPMTEQQPPISMHEQNALWALMAQTGLAAEKRLETEFGSQIRPDDPAVYDELVEVAAAGKLARNQMWEANLTLADYFIEEGPNSFRRFRKTPGNTLSLRRYVRDGLELFPTIDIEDVRQWARLGIAKAIYTFDPEKAAFATIAFWHIRNQVQRGFLSQNRTVRIPPHASLVGPELPSLNRAAFTNEFERGWSEELSDLKSHPEFLKTEPISDIWGPDTDDSEWDEIYNGSPPLTEDRPISLVGDEIDVSSEERLETVGYRVFERRAKILLDRLDERSCKILTLHLGPDALSYEAIAQQFNLSRSRIHQIATQALDILRAEYHSRQTHNNSTPAKGPIASPAVPFELLSEPHADLAPLPVFSINEKKMGISYHEWLNLAIEHIYTAWYEARRKDEPIALTQIAAQLGSRSVLQIVSSDSGIIINRGRKGITEVKRALLTTDGAQRIIEKYKERTQHQSAATEIKTTARSRAYAIGDLVISKGLLLVDPKTGEQIDPNQLEL